MKVLVVDDEPALRELLGDMVTELGHEPVTASNGQEAWEVYETDPIRLVVTDWMMPGVDGLELVRRIRAAARTRYTYVIVLTAMGGLGSYLEGMRAGADDFVTKPIAVEEFGARVHVAERILALQDQVKTLEGLLRICMYCKKVHVSERAGAEPGWTAIERYVEERSDASFSHDVCPACYAAHVMPEIAEFIERLPPPPDEGGSGG